MSEILPFATIYIDLESIILNAINQTVKHKYYETSERCVFSVLWNLRDEET